MVERNVFGDLEGVVSVNDNILTVATVSVFLFCGVFVVTRAVSVLELRVVSTNHSLVTVILLTVLAVVACAARVNEATNTSVITNCEFGYIFADSNNYSSDFVARNHWESSRAPLFASLMDVRVTDTSVCDFDVHIIVTHSAAFDCVGHKRLSAN